MNSDSPNLTHRIAFSFVKGMTVALGRELLARIGTEEEFFKASPSRLASLIGRNTLVCGQPYRQQLLQRAQAEVDFVCANSVRCLYFTEPDYPQRLLECDDAPIMLYALGQASLNSEHTVGIVGTRRATPYGSEFTARLVGDLRRLLYGVTTISGLAYGIDIMAHRESLKKQLPTVAVLGHGLSTLYPPDHRSVAAAMVKEGGLLITEYTHDAPIHRANFLARNRIIAGLSDAVVVAESALKGGAMSTANIASCYGRDVFALPGRISDTYSAGCNHLIANNIAHLATSSEEILQSLGWATLPQEGSQQNLLMELSPDEQAVVDAIRELGEAQINQLSVRIGCSINQLMSLLVDMEFKGLVRNYPGARYRLIT